METTPDTFLDLEIRIVPRQADEYTVYITLGEGGDFEGTFSALDLVPWISLDDPVQDGQRLFSALFADPALQRAWDRACGLPRHIRLWIDPAAADLHALPWELLRDGDVWLAANAGTLFSRYLPVDQPWRGALTAYPIRVLVAISNPNDRAELGLSPVDVEQEQTLLQDALEIFRIHNYIQLTFLDAPVTLARLDEVLQSGYHVLHFLGHGTFDAQRGQAALYLQDHDGHAQLVNDEDFSAMLRRQLVRPHLVFLAACQSAARATETALVGLGPKLVDVGVPAVVVMQENVGTTTVQKMTPYFYKALMQYGVVDYALNTARSILAASWHSDAWMPVLFMRLKEGKIWLSMEEAARVEAAKKFLTRHWPHIQDYLRKWRDDLSRSPDAREFAGILLAALADRPTLAKVRRDIPWMLLFGVLLFHVAEGADAAVRVGGFMDLLRRPREERELPSPPRLEISPEFKQYDFEPELVFVPAGEFLMGSDPRRDKDARENEQPQHTVSLPDYYIGKYPVTNVQYRAFVQATGHRMPDHWKDGRIPYNKDDHPAVNVFWHDAVAYCQWLANESGKLYRLPTEAEWEKAARGTDGRIWPWGDFWDPARCNHWEGGVHDDTTPVGRYSPQGDSFYGCADMAGNVWEWTSTRWTSSYERYDDKALNDFGDGPAARVVRGGAFYFVEGLARCAFRFRLDPYYRVARSGFRVVVGVGAAAPIDSGL